MKNKIIIFLWRIFWFKWIDKNSKIVKVKGWRTAIIDHNKNSRRTITPCFKIFGIEFN